MLRLAAGPSVAIRRLQRERHEGNENQPDNQQEKQPERKTKSKGGIGPGPNELETIFNSDASTKRGAI